MQNYDLVTKTVSINAAPRVGWFLSNRSVIGLEPGYSFSKTTFGYVNVSTTTDKSSTYSIKPFFRHYFPLGDKFAFYLHARTGMSYGKGNQNYYNIDPATGATISSNLKYKDTGAEVTVSPGIAFFLTPKWSIETMISALGYQYNKQKPENSNSATTNTFSFQHNVFSFGVTWYLAKKS